MVDLARQRYRNEGRAAAPNALNPHARGTIAYLGWNEGHAQLEPVCRGCDAPPVPGYVNCAMCLEERGNA